MSRLSMIKPKLGMITATRLSSPATERLRGRPAARMRERILRRDDYLCQQCLREGRVSVADEVDHIVPLFKGGAESDVNKQSLCLECHREKSAIEEKERRG